MQLDSKRVKKIFLLCGTNNIDNILKVPRSDHTNFIENRNVCEIGLRQSKTEISLLVDFIHDWSSLATINIINILHRERKFRNIVINELNGHISMLGKSKPHFEVLYTEKERCLFSFRNGHRKNEYFNTKGEDNVHLNHLGIVRLAKHLKYCAHIN